MKRRFATLRYYPLLLVKNRVRGFFEWLQKDYRRKRVGRIKGERKPEGEHTKIQEKGISPIGVRTFCGAIMSFYREFGYRVNVKTSGRLQGFT
ncbi:hypothetical protein J7L00_00820 [Candidatus Bathyarchaeota archaeon]|nr:hypothetical protein [Candidatus Bathyarchaeota archaeon]